MAAENSTSLNASSLVSVRSDLRNDTVNAVLIATYSVVLLGGVIGTISMSFLLVKMNKLSATTTAIINLVVVHSLFLVTVPFRLYYYYSEKWIFGMLFCKIVSAMLHIHMYLTFLFYVITLVSRWLVFFQWKDKLEFYRNLHAVAASAAVWTVAIVIVMPWLGAKYAISTSYENTTCFKFHKELQMISVKALNYIMIIVVISVTGVLLGFQIFIILNVVKKLSGSVWSHQEFWAQMKSFIFVCVIIICFLPYHLFRIYYISHMDGNDDHRLEKYNEICLGITAISCLDLLSFVISGSRLFKQKILVLRNKLLCC
uniref:Probable G-protein coupled receptor 141 n=1 Tax=Sphenodon punctatus TaxID=8508 RepID=A0A8D0L8B3_SPHPU